MSFTAPRRLHWLLLISAVVILLDRLTKTWVTLHIRMGGAIPVIPRVLRITHWTNEGAAFSLFANSASPQTVRWVLIGFSSLAALVVLFLLVRLGDHFTLTSLALALIFAGALGNVHDRIAYGSVVDFIEVHIFTYHWPDFNIADSRRRHRRVPALARLAAGEETPGARTAHPPHEDCMRIPVLTPSTRAAFAASAALLCIFLASASPANAARLPQTVRPEHYALTLTPDLKAATFSGFETIDVTVAEPADHITLNAAEIAFESVTVTAAGKQQTATVALDKEKEQATFSFPEKLPAGQCDADHSLHRHSERRTARLLSFQDRQAQLRRHPVRVHRRAPRLPLLRRAGLQGHLRCFAGDRQRRHRHLQRPHR